MKNIDKFLDFKMIDGETIPKIPLYMDQVTGYLDEIFDDLKRNSEEKILTKTMINNYVKAQIIKNPEKKKYKAHQIKTLMMIYMLKNTVQIQEIDTLLKQEEDMENLFEKVVRFDREARASLKESLENNEHETLDLILMLLLSSNIQKKYAELLLDQLGE